MESNIKFRMEFGVHWCKECEFSFLVPMKIIKIMRKRPYCPRCGENLYVEEQRVISMENPNGHKRNYTAEEEADIKGYLKKGYDYKKIAEKMNRTPSGMRAKINRMWEEGKLK